MRKVHLIFALLVFVLVLGAASTALAQYGFTGTIASGAQFDLYQVDLPANVNIVATLICEEVAPGDRPLDPVLSVFFPGGGDPNNTGTADAFNDDGFGTDDDPNGVDCNAFDSSRVRFATPTAGTYTFRADGFGSSTGPYSLRISIDDSNPFTDGRINPQQAAPVILYCDGTETVVFTISGEEIFRVENGESGSGGGAQINPLSDGRMQLNVPFPDGKEYIFVYTGCPHGTYEAYTGDPVFSSPVRFTSGGY